jgi:glutamine amidotransferase
MKEPTVAIVDYEMCNLFSVNYACRKVGLQPVITNHASEIEAADAVILPGVGAFGDAMENLRKLDLIPVLMDALGEKPFMGICLGLQLLFSSSDEFGEHAGLGMFDGKVERLPSKINSRKVKVPQMGWNRIQFEESEPVFSDVPQGTFCYFVHSYFVKPTNRRDVLSTTDYEGFTYCSSVRRGNVYGFQFHPEKSADMGLKIYRNWKTIIQEQG